MDNKLIHSYIITAGSQYLDIDAYACCIALQELLELQGEKAIAYSEAVFNYSIPSALIEFGKIKKVLPPEFQTDNSRYIIVDVSDPEYIKDTVPIDQVVRLFDHHTGFESYWKERIEEKAHIEFIGAAATQIYEEWKKVGLETEMSREASLLLIAAILDNTLNLTSSNTTLRDIEAFEKLCKKESIDEDWCDTYFSEVQKNIEADLNEALLKDMKTIPSNDCLPTKFAQLCVWEPQSILERLADIRQLLQEQNVDWFLNINDLKNRCSYFVCDQNDYQRKIELVFGVHFEENVAKSTVPYLRKEMIKKINDKENKRK